MKKRNWKTSLLGVAVLALTGLKIYNAPNPITAITDEQNMASIAAGVGLLAAKDSESAATPTVEPKK